MDEVIEEASKKYQGLVPLVYDIETMCLDEARPQDMPYAVYLKREADKVIAHHKYKRCLKMTKWCYKRWIHAYNSSRLQKARFYAQWQKRWLELAEKFKEASDD